MKEIWKEIEGFRGKYFVSDLGRVKNKDGRIISQHARKNRYSYVEVELRLDGARHWCKVQRGINGYFFNAGIAQLRRARKPYL